MTPPSDDKDPFGVLVRKRRQRIGLTQQQLADFSTISVRAIRNIEQGKALNPRKHTVSLIANGLRLSGADRVRLEAAADRNGVTDVLEDDFLSSSSPPRDPGGEVLGRDREIAVLEAALSGETGRLVTVTGLPGVGKTRLAAAVAERLHSGSGTPVLWAECTSYGKPPAQNGRLATLVHKAGDELTSVRRGGSGHQAEAVAALADLIGERRVLLVLDGVAPSLLDQERTEWLCARCPALLILTTSVAPQGLENERLFLLGPLALPKNRDQDPHRAPAVSFFLRRWRMLRPDLTDGHDEVDALVRVCRSLDGLPGALDAAASWLSVYEPSELAIMVEREPLTPLTSLSSGTVSFFLGDRLREAIDLLGTQERALLSWLCEVDVPVELDRITVERTMSLAECGRLLHSLIAGGFVRRPEGSVGLAPLGLVRALVKNLDGKTALMDDVLGVAVS